MRGLKGAPENNQRPPAGLIGPDAVEIFPRRIRCGDQWLQTLCVTGYPREVKPGWLQPLLAYPGPVDVAVHVEPYPAEIAADRLKRQLARLESSRRLDEKRQRIPDPTLEAAVSDASDLSSRLAKGEERMFRVGLYLTVRAFSEDELDREVKKLKALCASLLLDTRHATFRALEGFITTLPLGVDALSLRRTFDTSALATTFPFGSAELSMSKGIFLGRNQATGGLIFFDRFSHDNHNQVILARSGAGKSFLAKLIVLRSLYEGIEVLVIDPEGEYKRLADSVGGTVISLGPGGSRLNPLDLPATRSADAVAEQALFCHTLIAALLGGASPQERAALDHALLSAYERAGITSDPGTHHRSAPLLKDVVSQLGEDDISRSLAFRLKPFVSGSHRGLLDRPTTSRPDSHVVVLSLKDVSDELKSAATLMALDAVWRRVRSGERKPRVVVIDEAWWLLSTGDDLAPRYLQRLAKSARKHYCGLLTITQDVGDVLESPLGAAILSNASSCVVMRQSPQSIDSVAEVFKLSLGEKNLLLSSSVGAGLFIAGDERAPIDVIASEEEHRLAVTGRAELETIGEGR